MPIKRRQTTHIQRFDRPGPEEVTYDLSQPNCVTITLPVSSTWSSGPHWHETHTEYLQVLQGRAYVRLGDAAGEYSASDGVIEVPKYAVHEWHRASLATEDHSDDIDDGGELVVREWTVPEDGQKEVFFRMLNSFLTEPRPSSLYDAPALVPRWILERWMEKWIVMLQLFCIFRSWDNWPVMIGDGGGLLGWMATHVVLGFCSVAGWMLGLRGTYPEYVTEELRLRATGKSAAKLKTR